MNEKIKNVLTSVLIILMMAIVGTLIFSENVKSKRSYYRIIVEEKELYDVIGMNKPYQVLIDLRNSEDYEDEHLEGFINIPYKDGDFLKTVNENYYKGNEIVLMCYSGKMASYAFNDLISNGYRNIIVVNIDSEDIFKNEIFDTANGPCNCFEEP